jgi:hypothetical protein
MQKERKESSPSEEDNLHDAYRETSLQHRAGLVDVQLERVICLLAVLAEWAEGDPDAATGPAGAVCIGDKAELVDTCDEGAEEEHVDKGDEECGALGCAKAD